MQSVIQVSHLRHLYGDQVALEDLSFEVERGEVFGLLGPNGAGKTTTVRLLNGMFEPTGGKLQVLGADPSQDGAKVRAQTGVLTETPALYERLTARQNLRFFGVLAGMEDTAIQQRSNELLDMFGLSSRADDRTGTYSKGMKQRLALARAWLTRPKLLFLDEPTSGLDPEASVQVRDLIADVREKEGTTVLICTHNLDEAQRLCDRLLVLKKGTAAAQGSLRELRNLVSPGMWLDINFLQPFLQAESSLQGVDGVLQQKLLENSTKMRVEVAADTVIPQVIGKLVAQNAQIVRVQPEEISLEEVYLQLQNNGTYRNGKGE